MVGRASEFDDLATDTYSSAPPPRIPAAAPRPRSQKPRTSGQHSAPSLSNSSSLAGPSKSAPATAKASAHFHQAPAPQHHPISGISQHQQLFQAQPGPPHPHPHYARKQLDPRVLQNLAPSASRPVRPTMSASSAPPAIGHYHPAAAPDGVNFFPQPPSLHPQPALTATTHSNGQPHPSHPSFQQPHAPANQLHRHYQPRPTASSKPFGHTYPLASQQLPPPATHTPSHQAPRPPPSHPPKPTPQASSVSTQHMPADTTPCDTIPDDRHGESSPEPAQVQGNAPPEAPSRQIKRARISQLTGTPEATQAASGQLLTVSNTTSQGTTAARAPLATGRLPASTVRGRGGGRGAAGRWAAASGAGEPEASSGTVATSGAKSRAQAPGRLPASSVRGRGRGRGPASDGSRPSSGAFVALESTVAVLPSGGGLASSQQRDQPEAPQANALVSSMPPALQDLPTHSHAKQLAVDLLDHLTKHNCLKGVVDELPPVREEAGELRVLGVTLSPSVARQYLQHEAALRAHMEHYVRTKKGNKKARARVMEGYKDGVPVALLVQHENRHDFTEKVDAQKLEAAALEFLLSAWGQGHGRTAGSPAPAEPPQPWLVTEFTVGPNDEREGLRGKLGLKATDRMPNGTWFAVYTCYAMTKQEYKEFIALEDNKLRTDIIEAYTVEQEKSHWQPMRWDPDAEKLVLNEQEEPEPIFFMGFGYGNVAGLMNAPQKDPFAFEGMPSGEQRFNKHVAEDLVGPANATVEFVYVGVGGGACGEPNVLPEHVWGFPLPMARCDTTTYADGVDVKAGDELLYCYGYLYWPTLREVIKKLDPVLDAGHILECVCLTEDEEEEEAEEEEEVVKTWRWPKGAPGRLGLKWGERAG